MRHASHDEDVAMANAGRARHLVGNKVSAIGHARHAQAARVNAATRFIISMQDGACLWMNDNIDAERGCDRVNRNVIMRRANAAGGEQIVIARTQEVHRLYNGIHVIGDHTHFAQANALNIEPKRNLANVFVLCSAREDLVADDYKRCGIYAGICHTHAIA